MKNAKEQITALILKRCDAIFDELEELKALRRRDSDYHRSLYHAWCELVYIVDKIDKEFKDNETL